MISVSEDDGRAQFFGQIPLREAFDGGLRAHGHEHGGGNVPVFRVENAGAGAGFRTFGK